MQRQQSKHAYFHPQESVRTNRPTGSPFTTTSLSRRSQKQPEATQENRDMQTKGTTGRAHTGRERYGCVEFILNRLHRLLMRLTALPLAQHDAGSTSRKSKKKRKKRRPAAKRRRRASDDSSDSSDDSSPRASPYEMGGMPPSWSYSDSEQARSSKNSGKSKRSDSSREGFTGLLFRFFARAESFFANLPLTIGAIALSIASLGVVWFKFAEENMDSCIPVHFHSAQCTFPEVS